LASLPVVRSDVVTIGSLNTSTTATSANYGSPNRVVAQSFQYYSSNFTLRSISLNLFNTSSSNTGTYAIKLYSGNLPSSGSELGTGTWESIRSTNSANVITVSSLNNRLLANTKYWIGVEITGGNLGSARQWAFKDTNLFDNNNGYLDWAFYDGISWIVQPTTHAMGLVINGETAAVPEPGTLILTVTALLAGVIGAYAKRRRKTRTAIVA